LLEEAPGVLQEVATLILQHGDHVLGLKE